MSTALSSPLSQDDIPLDAVVNTPRLRQRPSRRPDYEVENRALVALSRAIATAGAEDILQRLVETLLEVCHGDSAGISIIEENPGESVFRWHALAGALAPHRWGTTPRKFSPCGTVVDRNAVQLMSLPERHFRYFAAVKPQIIEALLVPFSIEGKPIGTIWVVTHSDEHQFDAEDERLITDLAQLTTTAYQLVSSIEVVRTADRRKDAFLATLAHELRNPLSAAGAALYYIHSRIADMDDANLRNMSDLGQRQLASMKRMVEEILDFSGIGLGKLELDKHRVQVAAVVRHATETVRGSIEAGRHELVISLPEEPIWLYGDAGRLTQAVSNLLGNAAKYTPAGGRIEVSAQRLDTQAIIQVSDNGIGIAAQMLPNIFELFSQAETSRERAQGGLGIGLSLARRLIRLHGGDIQALSGGLGKGCTFVIQVPLANH